MVTEIMLDTLIIIIIIIIIIINIITLKFTNVAAAK